MTHKYVRTSWDGFPNVHVLYPLKTLINASNELYIKAKSGDVDAAIDLLVNHVLHESDLAKIAVKLEGKSPILVPVLAIESSGKNRIPAVFAEILGNYLGLKVCDDIVQIVKANHTNAGAYERIVRQPLFDGEVEVGQNYVILDDTVAMGGTLAALKGYIESQGGCVILAVTLTGFTTPELDIVPSQKMLKLVIDKHTQLAEWWQNEFGFQIEYLTQGELGHLRTPSSLDDIRNRLIAAGFQSGYESSESEN